MPEREMSGHREVRRQFEIIVELDSQDVRDDHLSELEKRAPSVAAEVRKLIAALELVPDFLERPPTWSSEADEQETQAPSAAYNATQNNFESLPCEFGDYELLEKIAHGGMGIVFRARHRTLNRIVAIKMILSGELAGDAEVERFRVEAEAAGRLDHPGIVPVYDIGFAAGRHYFSMAYVNGQSLSSRIQEGPLGPHESAALLASLGEAIQFAHDHGIVHRDLKPGNVLLDENGHPRITDFGLAKRIEADSKLTITGIVLGTPGYMPPEQASGKEIDASADVYSLGAILYAMLTGVPPFEAESPVETLLQVMREEPVAPRTINRNIPRDLEIICLKCLEKDVSARYSSANELALDLKRYINGHPIRARSDFFRRLKRWGIREPGLATHLLAAAAMIAIIFVNWMLLGETQEDLNVLKKNTLLLLAWAFLSFVFQKAQNRFKTRNFVPFAWSISNQLMLTVVLCLNSPPRGSLVSLYVLLMICSSFFRRRDIVVVTTLASLVGYAVLVGFFFEDSELTYVSYLVLQWVNIGVCGALLATLSRRMERMSDDKLK